VIGQSVSPIGDAQARAAEATAGALREAIQALRGLGGYLERVFGTVPEDLVGYLGGDRLKVARAENIVRIMQRSKELNDQRGVEPEPISISLALPLLVAAADESRDELVEMWARLLAAAADPTRTKKFRQQFIETAKQMDPIDAVVLQAIDQWPPEASEMMRIKWSQTTRGSLGLSDDEFEVSRSHLTKLGLLEAPQAMLGIRQSSFGREFLRAVSD
jgi:hypothetical protein